MFLKRKEKCFIPTHFIIQYKNKVHDLLFLKTVLHREYQCIYHNDSTSCYEELSNPIIQTE